MDHWSSLGSNLTSKENVWSGEKSRSGERKFSEDLAFVLSGFVGSLQSFERDSVVVLAFMGLVQEHAWGVEKEMAIMYIRYNLTQETISCCRYININQMT